MIDRVFTRCPSPLAGLWAIAFAPPFGSPLPGTPWLLLQEERRNTGSRASLPPSPAVASARFIPFMPRRTVAIQFRALCIPLPGCFSAFARATCALSVSRYIEGWRLIPPCSRSQFTERYSTRVPPLPSPTRLSLCVAGFSNPLRRESRVVDAHHISPPVAGEDSVCPVRLSLAVTYRISFDFLSCGY